MNATTPTAAQLAAARLRADALNERVRANLPDAYGPIELPGGCWKLGFEDGSVLIVAVGTGFQPYPPMQVREHGPDSVHGLRPGEARDELRSSSARSPIRAPGSARATTKTPPTGGEAVSARLRARPGPGPERRRAGDPMTTPTDPDEHLTAFSALPEDSRYVHLIEHGHSLNAIRELDDDELAALHRQSHPAGNGAGVALPAPPDLLALADKAVRMATGMREHLAAQRWGEAYAAADWLTDLADEIHSHVWAAHPDARPETW